MSAGMLDQGFKWYGHTDCRKSSKTSWYCEDVVHVRTKRILVLDVGQRWRQRRSGWTDEYINSARDIVSVRLVCLTFEKRVLCGEDLAKILLYQSPDLLCLNKVITNCLCTQRKCAKKDPTLHFSAKALPPCSGEQHTLRRAINAFSSTPKADAIVLGKITGCLCWGKNIVRRKRVLRRWKSDSM